MPLPVHAISSHRSFLPSLAVYGESLAKVYHENQRLGSNLASQRRWLITQTALALYWGGPDGLTAGNLIRALMPFRIASPNTIRAFLSESVNYGFLRRDPERRDIRPHYWQPTEIVTAALTEWIMLNLTVLDRIDGRDRAALLQRQPDLTFSIQPRLALNCLNDCGWREPPPGLALFQNTVSGGMVMDHIVALIGPREPEGDRYLIPALNARELSERIFISRTHLQRILRRAAESGVLGWSLMPFESDMWVERTFIEDYCRWQAIKSHHADEAFKFVAAGKMF